MEYNVDAIELPLFIFPTVTGFCFEETEKIRGCYAGGSDSEESGGNSLQLLRHRAPKDHRSIRQAPQSGQDALAGRAP